MGQAKKKRSVEYKSQQNQKVILAEMKILNEEMTFKRLIKSGVIVAYGYCDKVLV